MSVASNLIGRRCRFTDSEREVYGEAKEHRLAGHVSKECEIVGVLNQGGLAWLLLMTEEGTLLDNVPVEKVQVIVGGKTLRKVFSDEDKSSMPF